LKVADKERIFATLKPIIAGLGRALGSSCELVLHDFARTDDSIIAIENGHVTGRQVGDGLDELGFQLLQHNDSPPDMFNYRGRRNGKTLRSSSIILRDEAGKPFGALGINMDITQILGVQNLLAAMTAIEEVAVEETFERSVGEVLEKYIQEAAKHVGKEPAVMNKEDKLKFLRHLETRDAFLIRYSIDRVGAFLNISRYTLYTYLDEVRQELGLKPAVSIVSR
jgi:predicted transcriptional regulator YheO